MPTLFDLPPELTVIAVGAAVLIGILHGWREADDCYFYVRRDGKYTCRLWGAQHHLFDLNFLTVWTPVLALDDALGHMLPLLVIAGPYVAHLSYESAGQAGFAVRDWIHLNRDRKEVAAH